MSFQWQLVGHCEKDNTGLDESFVLPSRAFHMFKPTKMISDHIVSILTHGLHQAEQSNVGIGHTALKNQWLPRFRVATF